MADDRYGGYGREEGWRRRDQSIFTDDEGRWNRGRDDERGFFERAGDEFRSWFGDEEAERRRERDVRRDEAREAFGGRDFDDDRRYAERARYGAGGHGRDRYAGGGDWGRERGASGRSQWDENYRRWRDRQIERLDREYEDYCRERQRRFDEDFDSWRSSRLTEGGASAADFGGERSRATETAGATTAAAGTAPATEASAGGEPAGSGRGRGRSRG